MTPMVRDWKKCAPTQVCLKLLGTDGSPLEWSAGKNFWETSGTNPTNKRWAENIRSNSGDSDCVSMWRLASAIQKTGCGNVHINCEATRVKQVLMHFEVPGRFDIYTETHPLGEISPENVIQCFKSKCYDPMYPAAAGAGKKMSLAGRPDDADLRSDGDETRALGVAAVGVVSGAVVAAMVALRRGSPSASLEPLLG